MEYPGGKNADGVYHTIINQFPPHKTFIECFGGSGAIIKRKKPAERNELFELDKEVIKQFHTNVPYLVFNFDFLTMLNIFTADFEDAVPGPILLYADPPYLKSTRRSTKDLYKYEWTEETHVRFLIWAVSIKAMVVISAYRNKLYDKMLTGWRRVDYNAGIHGGRKAVESLYINYAEPARLHEYTYLGKNFRERERIKRMIKRKVAQLKKMPALEREAIIKAMLELRSK